MALITRRRFVHQTAIATAALYGRPMKLLGGGRRIFGEREQNAIPIDAPAITTATQDAPQRFRVMIGQYHGAMTRVRPSDMVGSEKLDVRPERMRGRSVPRWHTQRSILQNFLGPGA